MKQQGTERQTVAFALCGSFCSFGAVLPQIEVLKRRGWDVLPILSASAASQDTRFGTADALKEQLRKMTGHEPLTTLQAVEPLGPQQMARALVIAPATDGTSGGWYQFHAGDFGGKKPAARWLPCCGGTFHQ